MKRDRPTLLLAAVLVVAGLACIALRASLASGNLCPSSQAAGGLSLWTAIVNLSSLPDPLRATVGQLLILPIGALVTSFIRNVVGFQTFGTLTPSLLAISFLQADAATGGIVFGLVLLAGLGGRALLGKFKLLMGPRLSLVLTFLVLCLVAVAAAMQHYGFNPNAGAILLPLVILTMIVERFYISTEENGLKTSLALLAGTLGVAAVCLALLRWGVLAGLAISHPEGELLVAAAMILVGRYSGFRLTELWRFRELAGHDKVGERK